MLAFSCVRHTSYDARTLIYAFAARGDSDDVQEGEVGKEGATSSVAYPQDAALSCPTLGNGVPQGRSQT